MKRVNAAFIAGFDMLILNYTVETVETKKSTFEAGFKRRRCKMGF